MDATGPAASGERSLRPLNLGIVGLVAAALAIAAGSSPCGGGALAIWIASPVAVFVLLVLMARGATAQRVAFAALLIFGASSLLLVRDAAQPSDAFSPVVSWILPAALFVGAACVAVLAAILASVLSRRERRD